MGGTRALRNYKPEQQWVVWCGTNVEQDAITAGLGSECVSIYGRMKPDEKVALERRWLDGEVRVIVTKLSIYGWGVNWQHCHKMLFVGLSDSYEAYFQGIRRCYRYGQAHPVEVHIVLSTMETQIAHNVARKERDATELMSGMVRAMCEARMKELVTT